MSNFIKDYFVRLRHSDEKTKHRSALTISIVSSIIILAIAFIFLKDSLFNLSSNTENSSESSSSTENNANSTVSPLTSFSQIFKDTGEQFSQIKNSITDILSVSSSTKNQEEIKEENSISLPSSTTTIDTATSTN